MSRYEQQVKYEAGQLADLIIGVNQGTNGDPQKVNGMIRQLRGETKGETLVLDGRSQSRRK